MKRKLTSILLLSALLTAGTSTFVSCKDYDSDVTGDIQGQVNDVSSVLNLQITKLDTAVNDLANLTKKVEANTDGIDNLEGSVKATKGDVAVLETEMDAVQEKAGEALTKAQEALDKLNSLPTIPDGLLTKDNYASILGEVYASKSDLTELANQINAEGGVVEQLENLGANVTTIQTEVSSVKTALTGVESKLEGVESTLATVGATASSALALAQADSVRIDVIENMLGGDYPYSDVVADVLKLKSASHVDSAAFVDSIKVIKDLIAANLAEAKKCKSECDSLIKAGDSIAVATAVEMAVKEAADSSKTYTDKLNASTIERIDIMEAAYNTADETLSARIDSLASALQTLECKFNVLNDKLAHLITGINIDKVSNPVFGSLNLPVGAKSTILCAIYGTAADGVSGIFPSVNPRDYVDASEANWTLSDDAVEQSILVNRTKGLITDGYAGKLMLTINPANVDFSGVNVTLASRGDGSAPAAYQSALTLVPSTANVTTRSATNGAYDAEVYTSLNIEDLQASQIDVNETELADAARQIINKLSSPSTNRINLLDIAQDIYSNFRDAFPQYYSVRCQWNDGETTNEVNSDYEIAAVTMKPLSFSSFGGNSYSLPDIPEISDFGFDIEINYSAIDTTQIEDIWVTIPDAENIKINLKDGETAGSVTVDNTGYGVITINFDALKVEAGETKIRVSLDEMRRVVVEINDQVEDLIDGVTDQFQNIVDKINSSYVSKINSYINKVNGYIDRVNEYIQDPNRLLRPVMFYMSNDSYGRLSNVKDVPSVFNVSNGYSKGSLTLIPTSYSAELLAPAYQKWVQVSTVEGTGKATLTKDDTTASGVLLNGKERAVVLTGEVGSTYEVIYSAVDYYGKVSAKKYYIQIK